jgi:hypothetical protein
VVGHIETHGEGVVVGRNVEIVAFAAAAEDDAIPAHSETAAQEVAVESAADLANKEMVHQEVGHIEVDHCFHKVVRVGVEVVDLHVLQLKIVHGVSEIGSGANLVGQACCEMGGAVVLEGTASSDMVLHHMGGLEFAGTLGVVVPEVGLGSVVEMRMRRAATALHLSSVVGPERLASSVERQRSVHVAMPMPLEPRTLAAAVGALQVPAHHHAEHHEGHLHQVVGSLLAAEVFGAAAATSLV